MWLVALVLDSPDTEQFHRPRKFSGTVLPQMLYILPRLPSLAQMPPLEVVSDPSFDVGLPSAVPFRNEKKHSAELQVWSLWEKKSASFLCQVCARRLSLCTGAHL